MAIFKGEKVKIHQLSAAEYRFYQLAADNLPITPISYHPPANNTTLRQSMAIFKGEKVNIHQLSASASCADIQVIGGGSFL